MVRYPDHPDQRADQQHQESEVERQVDPGEDHQPEVQGEPLQLAAAPAEDLQPLCLHGWRVL